MSQANLNNLIMRILRILRSHFVKATFCRVYILRFDSLQEHIKYDIILYISHMICFSGFYHCMSEKISAWQNFADPTRWRNAQLALINLLLKICKYAWAGTDTNIERYFNRQGTLLEKCWRISLYLTDDAIYMQSSM